MASENKTPTLCENGCGLFGAPVMMNLCSKCHRDLKLIAAVENSVGLIPFPAEKVVSPAPASRCGCCDKKVGVVGFKCRCGATFCGAHRYPEEHGCSFDFKAVGKDAIAKANPVVKADKVERF